MKSSTHHHPYKYCYISLLSIYSPLIHVLTTVIMFDTNVYIFYQIMHCFNNKKIKKARKIYIWCYLISPLWYWNSILFNHMYCCYTVHESFNQSVVIYSCCIYSTTTTTSTSTSSTSTTSASTTTSTSTTTTTTTTAAVHQLQLVLLPAGEIPIDVSVGCYHSAVVTKTGLVYTFG